VIRITAYMLRDAHTRGRANRVALAMGLLLLLLGGEAIAKVQLAVDVGFNNRYRAGKWTPLYVTLQDTSAPRDVLIEVYAPTDRRYALGIRQRLSIGPTPLTVPIYVPLSYRTDETTVTVRDAGSGRRLEHLALADDPSYQGQGSLIESVNPTMMFVLISGSGNGARPLETQFSSQTITTAIHPTMRLPAAPIGYDGIDLLVLNQPDLAKLSLEQQQAIADWVRSGGLLVMWPGPEPVPAAGPLVEILPARIGQNRQFDFDVTAVKQAGLASRFAKIKGRELTDIAGDARPIPLIGDRGPMGYRRWVGLGQVAVLPFDASQLDFAEPKQATDFWARTLAGVTPLPTGETNDRGNYYYNTTDDPIRAVAMRQTLDWIGDVPGAGRFGFANVAIVLLAMMFIVGPVDWFVLKWMNRQPWTWVTISGWIGVVTIGSIYLGHVFKSGDVYFRTAALVDEAGGARVAAVDLAGIYSPQTTSYNIEMTPESWWRTASAVNMYGGGTNLLSEIACHQDYKGNRLMPLLINVWNVRFVEGQEFTPAPPIVQAQLKRRGDGGVVGTITNRAAHPISNLLVRTRDGIATLKGTVEPGATMRVDATLNRGDKTLAATTQTNDNDRWTQYQQDTGPTTRPTVHSINGLADRRVLRIDQQLADRDDVAAVYAEFETPSERATLSGVEGAITQHVGVVRALVPLE
jgi:hypothetical protein